MAAVGTDEWMKDLPANTVAQALAALGEVFFAGKEVGFDDGVVVGRREGYVAAVAAFREAVDNVSLKPPTQDEGLSMGSPIELIDLAVHAYNVLKRDGRHTIGDVARMSYYDLLGYGLGEKSADEVKRKMAAAGFPIRDEPQVSLDSPIEVLNLSVRAYRRLKLEGVDTLGDLTKRSYLGLREMKYFGMKSADEVKSKLAAVGYTLRDAPEGPLIT